jgi:pimeloyl-ACP methyl ester carboxylesterase
MKTPVENTVHRILACLALAHAGCAAHTTHAESNNMASISAPVQRAHAQINGIALYYEVHGTGGGTPLVLLHGGGSSIEVTYGHALPILARKRVVVALDEQNHGRSGHRNVPERFTDSADDVAALIRHLGMQQVDIMGFSNGGSVALQVAIRHRTLVRKLVMVSALTKRSGAPEQFWEGMRHATFADMPQAFKDAFLAVNADPALLHDMFVKDSERMQSFVDMSDSDVSAVDAPTLVVNADRDVPTSDHALEIVRLMPHARLLILPGTHGECLGEGRATTQGSPYPEVTTQLVEAFLDGTDAR